MSSKRTAENRLNGLLPPSTLPQHNRNAALRTSGDPTLTPNILRFLMGGYSWRYIVATADELESFYWMVLGGMFVVPFLTPILTNVVIARVFRSDFRALKWALLIGTVNIPLAWGSIKFGIDVWDPLEMEGWGAWIIAMVVSVALTALLTWSLARWENDS